MKGVALQTIPIKELYEGLYDGPHATPKPSTDGPVFLGIKNVTDDGRLDLSDIRHIAEDDFALWTRRVEPQPGDVVFTYEATLNRYAIVPEGFRGCLVRRMALIRPDTKKVDTHFLFYYFFTNEWRAVIANNLLVGSTVDRIPLTKFPEFPVRVPPLPVQRRIAGILSAYDDLIENNQRRIKILEEMARSLYREWFVHFRFPGHDKVKMVPSPLGLIPQGWEVKKLGNLISYNRCATKPGPHLDEHRYVPIDCLPSKSLALLEAKPIEEAQSSLQLFEKGDILFGAMRPYFHKVVVAPFAGVTRTTCFVFKPMHQEWHAFATMTAFEESTVAYANAHSQGATIPYAVWDGSLAEMPLVIPPDALLRRFEKAVEPMLTRISQSFFVLTNLRRTRDLLLPRLLSGQVNVA